MLVMRRYGTWLIRLSRSFVVIGLLAGLPGAAAAQDVLVFAAASLKEPLDEVVAKYPAAGGSTAKVSYASSSALARQIEQGAPADIFFSADLDWMQYLNESKLIAPATRTELLGNRLVLIAPAASDVKLDIAPGFPLAAALRDGRLAVGDPDHVPAGKYSKAALTGLGVWNAVESRLVRADNVRAALAFVARGEAPLGIVYSTDAAAEPKVKVVSVFPAGLHPPISYPVALTTSAKPAAAPFLDHLRSAAARASFEKHGFSILN